MAQRLSDIQEETKPIRLSDIPDEGGDPLVKNMKAIDERQAATEAEEPGAVDYLVNRAKKGLAGFADIPGQAIKAHPAIIPFSMLWESAANAIVPSRQGKTFKDVLGVDPSMKTKNDTLRYAGGIAEMVGAGGPIGGLRSILPSIGAGIGLEGGSDIAEGFGLNRQAGEAVGAIAGGIVPALGSSATQGGVGYLKRRFSPTANKAAAEGAVARELEPLVRDPGAQANLGRSLEISDEFTRAGREFTPSLPARTGSPALLAIEKDLVTRNPASLNKSIANVEKNEREIAAFVNSQFPGGKTNSVQRVAQLLKQAAGKLEAMRSAVDDKLDDIATVFERNPDNYEVGKRVRDLVFKQKEVYRGISGQKYQETYKAADAAGVKADVSDVAQFADDVLKSDFNAYQASEIPPVFRQLAKRAGKDLPEGAAEFVAGQMGKTPGQVSFAELHSLMKRANADLASLRGSQSADKGMKEYLLNDLKTRLEQKVTAFEAEGFGDVAVKLREANRFYRDEYLPRFKQGFGEDVLARYTSGEFKTPNNQITRLITRSNNAQAAKDFKTLFDDVPEAWQSLRDGYMDVLFSEKAVLNQSGRIDQNVLNRFLRQHNQTLKEFPGIQNEFKQLALDNQALLDRRARVVAQEKNLAAADLYKLFNGKDPSVVVPEAVANTNTMRVLVHKARNNPNEGNALARAIAEDVAKNPDPITYFNQNKDSLRVGLESLGKDHFRNLETVIEAMTINQRNPIPKFVQQSGVAPDAILSATGSSPRAMISHYVNIVRGRTGVSQEGAAFLGRLWDKFRTDHKAVVMEGVFYDPDVARAVAQLSKHPETPKFRGDFVNALATLGIRAEIAGQE